VDVPSRRHGWTTFKPAATSCWTTEDEDERAAGSVASALRWVDEDRDWVLAETAGLNQKRAELEQQFVDAGRRHGRREEEATPAAVPRSGEDRRVPDLSLHWDERSHHCTAVGPGFCPCLPRTGEG
jgi:hypothetical protein